MIPRHKGVPTLAELQARLQRKVNKSYGPRGLDNRFTLAEWGYLFAAEGKLLRIILADAKEKVPDDAVDVYGYMELFFQSFQSREKVKIVIRKEGFR